MESKGKRAGKIGSREAEACSEREGEQLVDKRQRHRIKWQSERETDWQMDTIPHGYGLTSWNFTIELRRLGDMKRMERCRSER